jgi:hypothetical protein
VDQEKHQTERGHEHHRTGTKIRERHRILSLSPSLRPLVIRRQATSLVKARIPSCSSTLSITSRKRGREKEQDKDKMM